MTEESPIMSRAQLLGLSDQRRFSYVDTIVGRLRLRTLTAAEAFEIDNWAFDSNGKYDRAREKYARAKRVVETVVDEQGNRMFSDMDLEAISKWPEPLMNSVAVKVVEMAKPESLGVFAKND